MSRILDCLFDESTVSQFTLEGRHVFCKQAIELLSLPQEELDSAGQKLGLSEGCTATELLETLLVKRYPAAKCI